MEGKVLLLPFTLLVFSFPSQYVRNNENNNNKYQQWGDASLSMLFVLSNQVINSIEQCPREADSDKDL
jgi:hypothetical protein